MDLSRAESHVLTVRRALGVTLEKRQRPGRSRDAAIPDAAVKPLFEPSSPFTAAAPPHGTDCSGTTALHCGSPT